MDILNNEYSKSPSPGCSHSFEDGRQCAAAPLKESTTCLAHSSAPRRAQASQKMREAKVTSLAAILGGKKWDIRSIAKVMQLIMRDVNSDDMEPTKAYALVNAANIAIRALDKGDLEARLEAIELKMDS